MSRADAWTYILNLSDANRLAELGLDRHGLIRSTDVAHDMPHMAIDYDPQDKVSCLDVFFASPLKAAAPNREKWIINHLSKWKDFCKSEPRFHEFAGAHYTMIGPEHVANFAMTLLFALQARGV
jgi:thioesterase domain-containing protein